MEEKKLMKLAKLARIQIKDEDKDRLLQLLNNDIENIKGIYNVDTDGLEPLTNPYDIELEMYEDIISDGEKQEELIKCSPKSIYGYYVVPKVIEE